MALLDVEDLHVEFGSPPAPAVAVDGIDLRIEPGERVGIVGESGSGKSVTALALMGLVDAPGRVRARRMEFLGGELQALDERSRNRLRGRQMAMIFQDPMRSLNPSLTIGFQVEEALRVHQGGSRRTRRAHALELLRQVELPQPHACLQAYPHQLSGGMNQRVMIAMAIACGPRLLIADEPTTALDVTVQAQILDLLAALGRAGDMALLLISHDLAVVAQAAQRVAVMYAGQFVETRRIPEIFAAPRHPYTAALIAAMPQRNLGRARLATIPGALPAPRERPAGCLLAPRCAVARTRCRVGPAPPAVEGVRCHFPLQADGRPGGGWEEAEP